MDAPVSLIDPIGNHYVGDTFTITGSTNLAVGDDLLVEIYSSSFGPTHKLQSGEFSGSTGTVSVVPGTNGYNSWSFYVDTSAFKPDEYLVKVSGVILDVTASTTFTVTERAPVTTTSSPIVTLTLQPNTTQSTIPPTLPPVTQSPFICTGINCGSCHPGFCAAGGEKILVPVHYSIESMGGEPGIYFEIFFIVSLFLRFPSIMISPGHGGS